MLSIHFRDLISSIAGKSDEVYAFKHVLAELAKVSNSFLETANTHAKTPQNLNIQGSIKNAVRDATREVGLWELYEACRFYIAS